MVYGIPYEDAGFSAAVNVCENCGQTCDRLIDLPTWNFKACATCAEEAAREDERQAAEIRTDFVYPPIPSRNFDWAAWIDGREEGPIGYGPTRETAIKELREQLDEEAA